MQDLLSNPNAISYFMKCKLFLITLALLPLVPVIAQTRQQTENLYTFARLYGVKHMHKKSRGSDSLPLPQGTNNTIFFNPNR